MHNHRLGAVVLTLAAMTLFGTATGCHRPAARAKAAKPGPGETTISGKILTARGTPPRRADAHVAVFGAKTVSVEAGRDGGFTVVVPVGRPFHLKLSAVDHVEANLPVILTKKAPASVTVRLAQDPFVRDAKEVQIAPDTGEGFSLKNAVPMTAKEDGTFVWEHETGAETVRYELLGISANDHSVNGTQSEGFEYDGAGDYESVVKVHGGHVRIVYDPRKLPAPVTGDFPVVTWDAEHADLGEMARLQAAVDTASERIVAEFQAYEKAHGSGEGFNFDAAELEKTLRAGMAAGRGPNVRAFAAVLLAQGTGRFGIKLDKDTVGTILRLAPPSSPMWAFTPQVPTTAFSALGRDGAAAIFERFAKESPSRVVRAFSLAALGYEARKAHDLDKQRAVYARLRKDYADVKSIRWVLMDLNPDKAIQVGRPVPPFSVVLFDGKTFTNKDLLGHYTLLDFWATWCGPCRAEMPNLHAAWKKFHDHNFQIVSFSFDKSPEAVKKFRQGKWKMPWRHTFVKDGFKSKLAQAFEVRGIPEPILVGPDGTILAVEPQTRGEQLLATIAHAMQHKNGKKK